MLVFFEKGAGGYFKLCFVGRDSGGEGVLYPQQRIKEAFTSSYRIKVV